MNLNRNMCLEITILKLQSYLAGDSKLICLDNL